MTSLLLANILCFLFLLFFIHNGIQDYKNEIYLRIDEQNGNLDEFVRDEAFLIITCLVFLIAIPLVAIYLLGLLYGLLTSRDEK